MSNKKCIKITPTGIFEIYNYKKDRAYKNTVFTDISLEKPEYWEYNKFRLTMITKDIFNDDDKYNHLASYLCKKLTLYEEDHHIFGTVFLYNEHEYENEILDFTRDDLNYIMDKIKETTTTDNNEWWKKLINNNTKNVYFCVDS